MKKEFFWAIKGWDVYFEGMNGMIEYEIFKGTESEAEDEGMELSYRIISSYSAIDEYIEEEVRSECEFNGTENCDCNKSTYIKDYFENKTHLEFIGKSIEENEGKLRLKLDNVF